MKIRLAVLAAACCAAAPALACFTVYDRSNNVLYNAQVPPVDMSRPLHETLPQKFPGGQMVFDQSVNCPIVQAAGQLRAAPTAPGRSPLLTDVATARSLGLKHTVIADGVAMDGAGNVYIAGTVSADFPTTDRSYDRLLNGEGALDYFVAQLGPNGSQLPYATLIPGTPAGDAVHVALDGSNTVVVASNTSSANFPTTAGAYQQVFGGGSNDDFVSQLTLLPNTISDTTPSAPSLLSPPDGATISADAGGNFDVTVSWKTAATSSGVQAYELQVSPNPAFIINSINEDIWLDDVYTTGATADGAARALGARVEVVTFARAIRSPRLG